MPVMAEPSMLDPDVAEIDAIERSLDSLPDRQRTALLLADLGGLSPAEVGANLGISPGAAKVLVHRARIRFRQAYQKDDT
jgi:RNA polymerase sigma-70 factor (ECF subfamily)